ncbi:MAG: Spy/CpxP family protein refolding chaperone [Holophagales bacterium]|nr:Spy/CpxP family protein refolding chaperone [Holophagales bacterium]
MPRLTALCLSTFLFSALPAVAQSGDVEASAATAQAAGEEGGTAAGASADAGPTRSGAWLENARERVRSRRVPFWRQEAVVADVGLTQAQVEEIEQLHKVFHKKRLELGQDLRRDGPDIASALALGDWPAARQLTAERAEAVAEQTTLETELKIQVLKGLTAEQRTALLERYRHLLQLPWLMAVPSSRYPAGRGGPLRQGAPGEGESSGGG